MTAYLTFDIALGDTVELGATPLGRRRMVPLLGGTVSGAFKGRVLPGGSDWQLLLPTGTLEINARYILETDAGELIEVQSIGIRACDEATRKALEQGAEVSPDAYYFRTAVRLFTAAPVLSHLNHQLFSARGERYAQSVRLFVNPVS